jgi:NhaC family Na+:H+ antiporter
MSETEPARQPRPPSLADSLIAIGVLIALVAASFLLFGENAAYGPTQVALILGATLAAGFAWKNGHAWGNIRKAVVDGIASALPAIFILLAVGALIGTWAMSGTLVTMVYYALGMLSPSYFYLSACFVCALVATGIGSSWTVVATIGLGLMGVAAEMLLSPAITAASAISAGALVTFVALVLAHRIRPCEYRRGEISPAGSSTHLDTERAPVRTEPGPSGFRQSNKRSGLIGSSRIRRSVAW